MPDAQLFNIASNAAKPPRFAPYPTEVGTAITGTSTSPPSTLARAPSIPATATITLALSILCLLFKGLCIPATPTSYILSTTLPKNLAV
ncbi:hypothetical protein BGU33_02420 [Clostridioides difficile]|nr:hypothetical protein BGU33_02420 [Clostridioides difficile]